MSKDQDTLQQCKANLTEISQKYFLQRPFPDQIQIKLVLTKRNEWKSVKKTSNVKENYTFMLFGRTLS